MTEPAHPSTNHLARIRARLAQLVAHLEAAHPAAATRPQAAATALTLGRALLRRVTLAEEAVARDREAAVALGRIEQRHADAFRRLDELQEEIEHLPDPRATDDERPRSSGSTIGDAVRDSFLNMP